MSLINLRLKEFIEGYKPVKCLTELLQQYFNAQIAF